ncbi:dTDP-glucose 4,6-dehydratase [Zobellia galactanivorans]|uniref:dTDP-glucose 4,6-dehydratase n=1 Tax=Zobellia galactanivorans (strain DSM 12802 / CCUG 47099 / CIP 106680 / NCIMB 13871 / Dsij) TaxID=63186 RepID=UPI001C0701E1|nr:dTDP-glucose 4,6-dehydratase [Zobellia galactanivorans]MBU3026693.1 dTDP-glucose 4,6-dehydratase [Zobellia galactanivorans]
MPNRTILITGGAGFIGSNFIPFFLEEHRDVSIVNLDKLTYAGNLDHLEEVRNNERYKFVQGDICDAGLVGSIFNNDRITDVIHFAAESHVDNSIEGPEAFIKTNINGTFTLLEAARKHWLDTANHAKTGFETSRFHHISTDEVYGSLGESGFFDENTAYAPNSPYSASKAASDFLVRSYFHTYGLNVVTSNCSNNYGPKQHDEKLIPTIIRKALAGEEIPIYGDGKNVRDWLYVLDHCTGINAAFTQGKAGETYVVGGNNEHNNIFIAQKICAILDEVHPRQGGSYTEQITFVKDRLGHDFRYAIDATKIKTELDWRPKSDFDSGLRETVSWYINKYQKV